MAYSEEARDLRRCQAITVAGNPCRCWAIWGNPDRLCSTHAGRTAKNWQRYMQRHQAAAKGAAFQQLDVQHARYQPCTCAAYRWPHRPGGGLCRWPDPPQRGLSTPPSTHAHR